MDVMCGHIWHDDDVERVTWNGHKDNREIVLKETNEGSLIISKEDVIALANEFDLAVYPEGARL